MTIDLDALEAAVAEGEKKNFFVAPIVKELIAELREARGERAAVVARLREENRKLRDVLEWVNNQCPGKCSGVCDAALRGEHRREEKA